MLRGRAVRDERGGTTMPNQSQQHGEQTKLMHELSWPAGFPRAPGRGAKRPGVSTENDAAWRCFESCACVQR